MITRDIELTKTQAQRLARYGEGLLRLEQIPGAVIALHDAAAWLDDAPTLSAYAVALAKAQRTGDAIGALCRAVERDPKAIEAWCILAELAIDALDFGLALKALKACLALDPGAQHASGLRARALIKKAEKLAQKAVNG